jgi:hypothetical protein
MKTFTYHFILREVAAGKALKVINETKTIGKFSMTLLQTHSILGQFLNDFFLREVDGVVLYRILLFVQDVRVKG